MTNEPSLEWPEHVLIHIVQPIVVRPYETIQIQDWEFYLRRAHEMVYDFLTIVGRVCEALPLIVARLLLNRGVYELAYWK